MVDQHTARADRYFGHMFGIVQDASSVSDVVIESDRRERSEEGFGDAWPVLALRRGSRCWVSMSPAAHAAAGSRADSGSLLADLREGKGWFGRAPSRIFLPTEAPPATQLADGVTLRVLRDTVHVWTGGYIPEASISAGTAFGAFLNDELVAWAEATPLPASEEFSVMLAGIETHPMHRRRGYAKALLAWLTQEVCWRNLTLVYFCASRNEASQRTALSCGFSLYGEWWRLRGEELG